MIHLKHWQTIAILLDKVAQEKGVSRYRLAKETGASESTIKRFFELDFCVKFDLVLEIARALDLKIFFQSEDSDTDLGQIFEKAMEEKIGVRAKKLPKN